VSVQANVTVEEGQVVTCGRGPRTTRSQSPSLE
jgi:hypothetical protein